MVTAESETCVVRGVQYDALGTKVTDTLEKCVSQPSGELTGACVNT